MHHVIKVALVLLASVAAFLVYGFTALIAPWPVAVFAAGSLVSTYIGLAFADISAGQQRNAVRVAVAAMVIEALYGTPCTCCRVNTRPSSPRRRGTPPSRWPRSTARVLACWRSS
ncbi:MAG: hypothetical protein WCP31_11975 [Chloroflexales bacterium]